ncbi:hypothetical protein [Cystobacter ferrugineus]|uniref:Uncharacterized protein n=1 Tax=Cystobacter ferrugineus TaxID=83449 RepID=A0A1L9B762_9BACT|nr:hypothetical protein [Cystobacter ferrugineus]OJH38081.1 hypothetical protein BON30_23235 [Cystobacter ferrugineus]
MEQSWAFPRAPEGEGDLRVRIPVEGLSFMGATPSGLHFADERTGLGFRYGQATWVDANDRRTELKATYEAGQLLVSVPRALVEASAYPASLAPVISPELGLDGAVVTPAPGNQVRPVVAPNGLDFLVVWQDDRLGGISRIYGTRVTRHGLLVDPSGLRIGTASGTERQESPAVACDGGDCLVVWAEFVDELNANILGARVSVGSDDAVLDSTPLAISTAEGHQTAPAVAEGRGDWFVVWEDTRGAGSVDIRGARVMHDGRVAEPEGLAIATGPAAQRQPAVTYNYTDWLIVWVDEGADADGDIHGARVSPGGVVLDSPALVISSAAGSQRAPVVASYYGPSLVVWEDSGQGGDTDIHGARVTVEGAVLDEPALVLGASPHGQFSPKVIQGRMPFLVYWDELDSGKWSLQGTRVTSDGEVEAPGPRFSVADATWSSSAVALSDFGQLLVVWSHQSLGGSEADIQGAMVPADGSEPLRLELSLAAGSASAASEHNVKVAFNGTDYLLVWEGQRGGTAHIQATRVSRTGEVLDPSGISLGGEGSSQRIPAVASDGVNWLVVWADGYNYRTSDIYGALVSSTGEVSDPRGVPIRATAAWEDTPAVASNGEGYLVVWTAPGYDRQPDVLGMRVTSQGEMARYPLSVTSAAQWRAAPPDESRAPAREYD